MDIETFKKIDSKLFPTLPSSVLDLSPLGPLYSRVHHRRRLNELGALSYIIRHRDEPFDLDTILRVYAELVKGTELEEMGLKQKTNFIEQEKLEILSLTCPVEETAERMTELCERYAHLSKPKNKDFDDIFRLSLDLLAIHPVVDGNGRLSILLTQFLLLKMGLECAPYLPLDAVIFGLNGMRMHRQIRYGCGVYYGQHPIIYEKYVPFMKSALMLSYELFEKMLSGELSMEELLG